MRLIDADALIKRWSDEHGGAYFLPSEIVKSIEEQPTADAVERKRGKWEEICSAQYWQYTYEHYRCTNCGLPANCAFRYCPNCGADMRGGDKR